MVQHNEQLITGMFFCLKRFMEFQTNGRVESRFYLSFLYRHGDPGRLIFSHRRIVWSGDVSQGTCPPSRADKREF